MTTVQDPAEKLAMEELERVRGVNKHVPEKVASKAAGHPSGVHRPHAGVVPPFCWALTVIVILVLVIVVPLVVTNTNDDEEPVPVPTTVDYETGVTLVTTYGVRAEVTSRLLRTIIDLEVSNALFCSSIRSISLQLPERARVTSLSTTNEDDTCTSHGQVKPIKQARKTFLDDAAEGLPTVYLEQQNTFTHSLQVAVGARGKSKVQLVLEELLQQRLGQVNLQIPFAPNEDVDQLSFELTGDSLQDFLIGDELNILAPELQVMVAEDSVNRTRLSLSLPDAREHGDLPRVVRASYTPSSFPDTGVLYTSGGNCFEHYFRPSELDSMAKNIVFVFDLSDSMRGTKLNQAKAALKSFITETLTPRDSFTIQLFGDKGTMDLIRAPAATDAEKSDAIVFMNKQWPSSHRTNLHAAFLEGLLRAQRDMDAREDDEEAVPTVDLIVFISDGWATTGQTNRRRIVEDIYHLNQSGKKPIKIFTLGFRDYADMELLNAIAAMNGGVSATLVSDDNVDWQMENFFLSEFGEVLLADVSVDYEGGNLFVYGETEQTFPLLAGGYEVVVRGLYETDNVEGGGDDLLRAVTKATTTTGSQEWVAKSFPRDASDSVCLQSYAHARISQLLRLKDLANLVGDETLKKAVGLREPCEKDEKMSECIEEEALAVALEAGVVATGLTGMVTVDEDKCFDFAGETEICRDGTTASFGYASTSGSGYSDSSDAVKPASWPCLWLVMFWTVIPVAGLLLDWL